MTSNLSAAFAAAWAGPAIVQRALHRLPWGVNLQLLDWLEEPTSRLWYAEQADQNGWSRHTLAIQIERRVRGRKGQATYNFTRTLPLGVAHAETMLVESMPKELEESLPTVAEIEAALGGGE